MLFLLFVACGLAESDDSDATADSGTYHDSAGYHLLISGQMVLADEAAHGVYEVDEEWEPTWIAPIPTGSGGFGAARAENRETVTAWTSIGSTMDAGLSRFDAIGQSLSQFDTGPIAELAFPHGVAVLEGGEFIVGDGWTGEILRSDAEGNIVWRIFTPTFGLGQVPSGLRVFQVGGRPLLVATLLGEGPLDEGGRFDQVVAWWIDGESPELAWAFPPERDPDVLLWVHGPQQLADGSILVSSSGLGQIVRLDPWGNEVGRVPPMGDPFRFAFPRDAVMLPDGDLLVLDATEVLRVRDPFGAYEVELIDELFFGYSLDLLDCGAGECIGGEPE